MTGCITNGDSYSRRIAYRIEIVQGKVEFGRKKELSRDVDRVY